MSNRISRRSFFVQAAIALTALSARSSAKAPSKWDGKMELEVAFEINQPEGGRRYQRPYVAVWLEDASGKPVRTLSLWYQAGKGDRWLPDLRRWFRGNDALADVTSGPTRPPGQYKLVWDGKTDKKAVVDQGEYFLCIEAAREHGTYQLIREKLEFATSPFAKSFAGNEEIKAASATFRKVGG